MTYINKILVLCVVNMEKSLLVCGGASDVDLTGSGFFIELNGVKIQVDGWDFQWNTTLKESKDMYDQRNLIQPDVTFVTHTHIDHVAWFPIQQQNWWFPKTNTFYMSHMSKAVLSHVLGDSHKLQHVAINKLARKSQNRAHLQVKKEKFTAVAAIMSDKGYSETEDLKDAFYDDFHAKSNWRKDKGSGEHKRRGKHLARVYNNIPANYTLERLYSEINDIDKKMEYLSEYAGDYQWRFYSEQAYKSVLKNSVGVDFLQQFPLQKNGSKSNILATLYPTGHIGGAAAVLFEVLNPKTQEEEFSLMFSGDIGRKRPTPFQKGFIIPEKKIDTLVMESTYGDKNHLTSYPDGLQNLSDIVNQAKWPTMVFAISYQKFQEILLTLLRNTSKHIYCFGKLPQDYTNIFAKNNPELFGDLENNPRISREAHKQENDSLFTEPDALFLATSGMMLANANMIARALCNNPSSTIISTNYLPHGTPGHRLRERNEIMNEDGTIFGVFKGKYHHIDGLSGHGDQSDIVSYVLSLNPNLTILTHGELNAKTELQKCLVESGYQWKVVIPKNGDKVDIVTGKIS